MRGEGGTWRRVEPHEWGDLSSVRSTPMSGEVRLKNKEKTYENLILQENGIFFKMYVNFTFLPFQHIADYKNKDISEMEYRVKTQLVSS